MVTVVTVEKRRKTRRVLDVPTLPYCRKSGSSAVSGGNSCGSSSKSIFRTYAFTGVPLILVVVCERTLPWESVKVRIMFRS